MSLHFPLSGGGLGRGPKEKPMKKALIIAQKDILIRLYDRSGFAFALITPFILTVIMGAVFGGGTQDDIDINIPVAIINHDTAVTNDIFSSLIPAGENADFDPGALSESFGSEMDLSQMAMGEIMVEAFTSEEMAEYLDVTVVTDEAVARQGVKAGNSYCCLIIIPADFSAATLLGEPVDVIVYSDPARLLSAQIVESIVRQITSQFSAGSVLSNVTIEQLFASGTISSTEEAQTVGLRMGEQLQQDSTALESEITLQSVTASGEKASFDPLAFLAPSMAMIFLGFGASAGARTILEEEQEGTFARLNATPTGSNSVLLGKLLGIFFTSALQFGVLVLGSALIFGLRWGDPLGVLALSIMVTLAFTSLGLFMAVVAKDEAQAGTLGNTVLLVFAIIGGNLVSIDNFPPWLRSISQLTPNYWGVQGFIKLAQGQSLPNLLPAPAMLALMSLVLFTLGVVFYKRRARI